MRSSKLSLRKVVLAGAVVAGVAVPFATSSAAQAETVPVPIFGCTPSGKTCGGFLCQIDGSIPKVFGCKLIASWPTEQQRDEPTSLTV